MEDETPDPLDTVTLLKSDFDLLQAAANAAQQDYEVLRDLLRITPGEGKAPREVMYEQILPVIAGLLVTQEQVGEAEDQLRTAAARYGNTTIDTNGVKGVLVGKKNPALLAGLMPASRRERRELDRRSRP